MTLTELSYYSRKMLPFGILTLLFILIVFYAFKIIFFLNGPAQNNQVVATKLFQGEKIQAPLIQTASSSANMKFNFDTIEGKPITATLSAQIFVLPPSTTKFGFREKIQLMAKTLGIDTDANPYSLTDKDAVFKDDNQQLHIDISTFNFDYQYDLQKNPDLFTNTKIPDEQAIIDKATDFLRSVDRYPDDFARSKPSIIYYTYNPNTTQLTISNSPQPDSNMAEVDFFRPDIDAVPAALSTVTSKFPNSQNYVAMVFTDTDSKVVKAQVKYYPSSADQVGIYPLKTGDVAYKELQEGKGLVVNGQPNQPNITIKKMFLAYYDPDEYQPYLQPVYVFVGDNDFVGYVPAVEDALLSK